MGEGESEIRIVGVGSLYIWVEEWVGCVNLGVRWEAWDRPGQRDTVSSRRGLL